MQIFITPAAKDQLGEIAELNKYAMELVHSAESALTPHTSDRQEGTSDYVSTYNLNDEGITITIVTMEKWEMVDGSLELDYSDYKYIILDK